MVEAYCVALYAGAEAERLICLHTEDSCGDEEAVTDALRKIGVPRSSYVGDEVWEAYEKTLRNRARGLVALHRWRIERVAAALLEHKTLDGAAVTEIAGLVLL